MSKVSPTTVVASVHTMADEAGASGLRDDRNVCQLCGALENLSLCGGCRDTWYCSKDHQRAHWKQHKRKCKGRQQPKLKEVASSSSKEGISSSGATSASVDQQGSTSELSLTSFPNSEPKDRLTGELQADKTAAATPSKLTSAAEVPKETEYEKTNFEKTDSRQELMTPAQSKYTQAGTARRKEIAGQLPAGCEEGIERYFLDTKPFSQTIQSSKHTDRARRSANAMSPQGATLDTKDTYLDILKSRFSVIAQYVVKCLNTYGICVIDGFLGEATGQEILTEVKQLQDRGVMRQGQLVQSPSASSDNIDIRGDIITWVDGRGRSCENIQFLVSCMDAVVQNCSTLMEGYTINERTKVHKCD